MNYYRKLTLRLILAVIAALSYNIAYFILGPLTLWTSYITLKIFSSPILNENSVIIGSNTLKFIPACAAVSAYLLLAILVLLTKDICIKTRIKMFIAGSLLIFLANLIRIDLLIIILIKYGVDYFRTLHLFFWHIVSSVFVALIWIYLVKKFKIKEIPIYSDFVELKKELGKR